MPDFTPLFDVLPMNIRLHACGAICSRQARKPLDACVDSAAHTTIMSPPRLASSAGGDAAAWPGMFAIYAIAISTSARAIATPQCTAGQSMRIPGACPAHDFHIDSPNVSRRATRDGDAWA